MRKKNIGRLDQFLRMGISAGMIYAGAFLIEDPFSAWFLGALGVGNFIVALVRYCPLYAVTGIDTLQERGG